MNEAANAAAGVATGVGNERRAAPSAVEIALQYAVGRSGLPARPSIARWLGAALPRRHARVTVRFVGGAEGRRLNRDYRRRDYATNVLTFHYPGATLDGDIVLCAPVIAREARAQRKTLIAHCAHLAVHGALHLAGYDHERPGEALAMAAAERRILAGLGYADPYAAEQSRDSAGR